MNRKIYFLRFIIIFSFLLIWEILVRVKILDFFYISSPIKISKQLFTWLSSSYIYSHLFVTIMEAFFGFLFGLVLGIFLGFLFALNKTIDQLFNPFFTILNSLPRIAFAPIIILWFGLGFFSKIIIVLSLTFFVIFFNTYNGVKDVNKDIINNARILGAKNKDMFIHIYFPSAFAWIFTSLRTSVGFAFIGAIVGEYIGASKGIGFVIENSQARFDSTAVLSGLILLTIIVAFIDFFLNKIEKHFLKWRGV